MVRIFMLSLIATPALAAPITISHQGRLLDAAGAALTGTVGLNVTLYDAASAGTVLWQETQNVDLDNGFYAVGLGDSTDLDAELFDGSPLWIGVAVDGNALSTRIPLRAAPYAATAGWAQTAENVVGGSVDASSIAINGTEVISAAGKLAWTNLSGVPAVFADGEISYSELTDIPAVLADGEIAYGELTDIPAALADGEVDFGELTGVPLGLADGDDDALGALSCDDGEVPKASGGSWACGTDNAGGGSGGGNISTPSGALSWIWANNPTAGSYQPNSTYRYSTGSAPTITRSNVGKYQVSHPGVGGGGGTHQVTAYGGNVASSCKISSWGGSSVGVECYRLSDGQPMDSMYTILTMY